MLIDLTRRFTDVEWSETEKYFSLYFSMIENNRAHAECWDRENTPHDDLIPNEIWESPNFDWEVEYDKLWQQYWDKIESDPRSAVANEFYSYYLKVLEAFREDARLQNKDIFKIRKYQIRDCYEWLSKRGNVDILYNPFDNDCHVKCKEYDFTCWTIHGQPAEFFISKSKFEQARNEWGWSQIKLEDLQSYKQVNVPSVSMEQRYKNIHQIQSFIETNCTGAWFYYKSSHATRSIPRSWVFEKKSDAMLVKLRW